MSTAEQGALGREAFRELNLVCCVQRLEAEAQGGTIGQMGAEATEIRGRSGEGLKEWLCLLLLASAAWFSVKANSLFIHSFTHLFIQQLGESLLGYSGEPHRCGSCPARALGASWGPKATGQ